MSDCPPYVEVDMKLLAELFPTYNQATVWRLNTAKGGKGRLPAYDRVFGATRVWRLETILEWAKATGRTGRMDQGVLARIMSEQC